MNKLTAVNVARYHSLTEAMRKAPFASRGMPCERMRLFREVQRLIPWLIRANLEVMHLNDPSVIAVVLVRDSARSRQASELGSIELPLSDVCGFGHSILQEMLEIDTNYAAVDIVVKQHGDAIGSVDGSGHFLFNASPDLPTAIGWANATSGGRRDVFTANTDRQQTAERIVSVVRQIGPDAAAAEQSDEARFVFMNCVRGQDSGSYRFFKNLFWGLAIREIEKERQQPTFA